ncbi:DNA-formamidopyrimidine glycosylase family protein [Flavihumibacter petaseus]|uniref:Putative DNA glycosylase/AP lyase n=1 Tax=Flavihumibacter petaseus NBRC 106054 TaxID=1220578 RepID=A0A0E9MV71_9BACT|nr:DNA-formamidopyrimidine glycosylase family protein [Flavihumibacter petaseus]GAO41469.1 putative DNA glycosylase/AP lyase [Flavihumibacter petaseus NBRC 106054]
MPEGPSIVLAKEQLSVFRGKTLEAMGGYAGIGRKKLVGRKLSALHSWGKQLLLQFGDITLRVHFMLFGSYAIDPEGKRRAKMVLNFSSGTIAFYLTSLELLEGPLDDHYDWSVDILSTSWNPRAAVKKIREKKNTLICDCLMDQQIVSGSGNIIKNEVLFRKKVHPLSHAADIPVAVIRQIVAGVRSYARTFLKQKKAGTLSRHWQAYEKSECPRCQLPLQKKTLGKSKRRTYFCNNCQIKY